MTARVLVVYATHHGATRGIAERIAETLAAAGLDVATAGARDAETPARYDAFVIGSAVYAFHWVKDASTFVRDHRELLAQSPVWLFSSGPLGTETVNAKGQDVRVAAEPKEIAEFRASIHPRDHHVFWGAYDPTEKPIGFMERVTRLVPASKNILPTGDFRDWDEIDGWARTIATELTPVEAASA